MSPILKDVLDCGEEDEGEDGGEGGLRGIIVNLSAGRLQARMHHAEPFQCKAHG